MKLGLGSYALAWSIGVPGHPPEKPLDAFGFVELAAQHGFKLIQMADNLPLINMSSAELERLAAYVQSFGLEVELGARGIRGGNLERHLALVHRFGAALLRVVVDGPDHHPSPGEVLQTFQDVLPHFEAAGITLAIENHDRFSARTLADIVATLKSSYAGVCLDTANSFGALEGPEVVIETLGPFVVNVHVKDFVVQRFDHNMGFTITGMSAGQGMLDLPRLLGNLAAWGRDPNLILELWPTPETELAATIEKERFWLEESAAYLRTLLAAHREEMR